MPDSLKFLAHVSQESNGDWQIHHLEEHLREVARLAASFADAFHSGDWARLAGLWHDLGKYRQAFQHYIASASGYDAHLENAPGPKRVDHSTAGALHAASRLPDVRGGILAYLIAAHHAGLADWHDGESGTRGLKERLQDQSLLQDALRQPIPADILDPPLPTGKLPRGINLALWMRMLFSCLVDADFLDTEAFYDAGAPGKRGGFPTLETQAEQFRSHMAELARNAPDTPVNRIRARILGRCRERATLPPGIYSLTVPTGGGKTLSSLAFALEHARRHGKRRIIYTIPFTSIIEQTATVFRRIFGDAVVEHHSNLDPSRETPKSRLATENWDAPLVVTTNVQLFESLFAARTSRVRKLHNLANSVVILDEVQTLPTEFLQPILDVLDQLRRFYGVTVLLCTATQPAFKPFETMSFDFKGLVTEELMDAPTPAELHEQLRRVRVEVPADLQSPRSWPDLAEELAEHPSVLCIVDRRDDCRNLWRLMPEDTVHLSALMCGEHRSQIIAGIKQALQRGEPVRVISTQLIEAGVDVDFPVVYRALGGLDAIAQAAGRCNREGRLPEPGRMVVFVAERSAPAGFLRQAQDTGRQLLVEGPGDPLAPENFERYFRALYAKQGKLHQLDKCHIAASLRPPRQPATSPVRAPIIAFRKAANDFRMIDDSYKPVVVRFGRGSELIEKLERKGPERWLLRELQRFVVNLPDRQYRVMMNRGDIRESHGIGVQPHDGLYDSRLGLLGEEETVLAPDQLII